MYNNQNNQNNNVEMLNNSPEINLYNNYMYFVNNYLSNVNNSINYLNNMNNNIALMTRNIDHYYYNLYNNTLAINNNDRENDYRENDNRANDYRANDYRSQNNRISSPASTNSARRYIRRNRSRSISRSISRSRSEENLNNNNYNYNQESFYNSHDNNNDNDNNDIDNDNDNDNDSISEIIELPNSPSIINNYENNLQHYHGLSNRNINHVINLSTTNINFSDIDNPLNDSCPITQDDFQEDDEVCVINHCKHIFKKNALVNWLHNHQTCPNCRHNILTNTNYLKYTNGRNSLILTASEFRRFLANEIVSTLINNVNSHGDNNSTSIGFSVSR